MGRISLRGGTNAIDGVTVEVARRRAKYIRVKVLPGGVVAVTVPFWRATLADAAKFLESKWDWVLETRRRVLSRPPPPSAREATPEEAAALAAMLAELHGEWARKLEEPDTIWKTRRMKTRWGVCNWAKRRVTYSLMLAGRPRELVEYIVVHELTHLKVHGHGPAFRALMDERMPDWRERRRRLR